MDAPARRVRRINAYSFYYAFLKKLVVLVFRAIKICENFKGKTNSQHPSIFTNFKNPPGRKFFDRERGHVMGSEGVCTPYINTAVVPLNNSSYDRTILVENWNKARNSMYGKVR